MSSVFKLTNPDDGWWFVSEWNEDTKEGDELNGPYDTEEEAKVAEEQMNKSLFRVRENGV